MSIHTVIREAETTRQLEDGLVTAARDRAQLLGVTDPLLRDRYALTYLASTVAPLLRAIPTSPPPHPESVPGGSSIDRFPPSGGATERAARPQAITKRGNGERCCDAHTRGAILAEGGPPGAGRVLGMARRTHNGRLRSPATDRREAYQHGPPHRSGTHRR